MAISVAIVVELFFKSSEMMAHFGKNPVSGGRPPSDSRIKEVIVKIIGVLFHISETELIVVDEFIVRAINIGIVSIM